MKEKGQKKRLQKEGREKKEKRNNKREGR